MKVIDVIKDLADGKEIKPFKIGKLKFRVNNKQLQEDVDGQYYRNVEWLIYKDWLNEEIEIIESIEDEFVDIGELNLDQYHGIKDSSLGYDTISTINDLIKNQKKIINKLKEEGK